MRDKDGLALKIDNFEAPEASFDGAADLVCLSHLRWDFVYQRPQHLLSRCARERRVFFIEEPIFEDGQSAYVETRVRASGVCVVVPHLPGGLSEQEINAAQRLLVNELLSRCRVRDYLLWYYTPMALAFTAHLTPIAVIYDCMDELSAFKGAPPIMRKREADLLARADIVFTGGQSLYESKRDKHPRVYAFPSSIDAAHFAAARTIAADPADQLQIPRPRLGYFGVIDERMNLELIKGIAEARPDWQLVMIGPVVKINPGSLPRRPNIHYLGGKGYDELPAYLSGWDVALMPFALNESTRFISPTKTPEYLAAGKRVVSTSVRDVIRPYGQMGLVKIADEVTDFVRAIEEALGESDDTGEWLLGVDEFLAKTSWDQTWARMMQELESAVQDRWSVGGGLWPVSGEQGERRSEVGGRWSVMGGRSD